MRRMVWTPLEKLQAGPQTATTAHLLYRPWLNHLSQAGFVNEIESEMPLKTGDPSVGNDHTAAAFDLIEWRQSLPGSESKTPVTPHTKRKPAGP